MYFDELERAQDAAIEKGTLDAEDEDALFDFQDYFDYLMTNPEGESYDKFPSANELSEDQRREIEEFLGEYGLWEEFREDYEDY